jgi:hypothetical protein
MLDKGNARRVLVRKPEGKSPMEDQYSNGSLNVGWKGVD